MPAPPPPVTRSDAAARPAPGPPPGRPPRRRKAGLIAGAAAVVIVGGLYAANQSVPAPAPAPAPKPRPAKPKPGPPGPAFKGPAAWSQSYRLTFLYHGQQAAIDRVTVIKPLNSPAPLVAFDVSSPGPAPWMLDRRRWALVVPGRYAHPAKIRNLSPPGRTAARLLFTWPRKLLISGTALHIQIPRGSGPPEVVRVAVEMPASGRGIQERAGGL